MKKSTYGKLFNIEKMEAVEKVCDTVREAEAEVHSDAEEAYSCILRNYGGRPAELDGIEAEFFRGLTLPTAGVPRPSVVALVKQNIVEPEARHLMLLTKSNAALGLASASARASRASAALSTLGLSSSTARDMTMSVPPPLVPAPEAEAACA